MILLIGQNEARYEKCVISVTGSRNIFYKKDINAIKRLKFLLHSGTRGNAYVGYDVTYDLSQEVRK